MRKRKNVYKMYAAWESEMEIEDLEAQSRAGWQLVKGGLFHCKFIFDDSVEYRYALDYDMHIEDPAHYRQIFADQGWEYINSTFNGWHYFRKIYDPSLEEEDYDIYTDTSSREEMASRLRRIACLLGVIELSSSVCLLAANLNSPVLGSILMGLCSFMLGFLLILSTRWIGRANRLRSKGRILIPIIVLYIAATTYVGFHGSGFTTQTEYTVPEDGSAWQYQFEVRMPDFYTFEVKVDAPENVTIVIVREPSDGGSAAKEYYSAEGKRIEQRTHLFLTPGVYSVYTQYQPGAEPGQTGKFKYELE